MSFARAYPEARDFEWLTDFPRSGQIIASDKSWRFKKHGAGICFVRKAPSPKIVVEMHDNWGNFEHVDVWRIGIFLQSVGIKAADTDIEQALAKFCGLSEA